MASSQVKLAALVALKVGVATSDDCIQPGGTSWLECIKEAGEYHLPEGTFILDRHFQMPDGVTILGAGPDKTIVEADHAVENGCGSQIAPDEFPGDPTTRIGFVLGNNCRIGKFKYLAKDVHRWQDYYGAALCGGAVFETPGCADAYCAGENIGDGRYGNTGVSDIVIEDVVITGKTPETAPQSAVFITQTKDLDNPTRGVHIKGVRMDHSFCDGINLHGAVRDAVVEECELSYQGDDNLAVWSAGDRADNITFRNNIVSQAKTENLPSPRWGNCVALYGGSRINVLNTTCYHSSNAGVRMSEEFAGSWGQNSQITVQDMVTDEDIPACQGAPERTEGCQSKPHPQSLPGWVQMKGLNCHEGHGAAVVPPDSYAPESGEGITAVACMAACAASTRHCTAVVTSNQGDCWLRREVDVDSCLQDDDFDLWMVPGPEPPAPPASTAEPPTAEPPTAAPQPAPRCHKGLQRCLKWCDRHRPKWLHKHCIRRCEREYCDDVVIV